jgi:hypothetical protein
MDVFTSITLNYLPKARVLASSLKRFHPHWNFHLLISDRLPGYDGFSLDNELDNSLFDRVVWLDDLDIPNRQAWIFKHTVVELCTAVKGVYLQELAAAGVEKIIYIDPDIAIFNELSPLEGWLDEHAILLAPHLLDFSDQPAAILDNEIAGTMRHGTFNLGFLAVNTTRPEGKRFVDWWGSRLMDYCYADYDQGLFTDQKWCDLVPSFFEDYFVIRDPGYDVASWNIDKRQMSMTPKGEIRINEHYPLRFYHFTGYDSGAGSTMTERYGGGNELLNEIWDWYLREIQRMGQEEHGKRPCFYSFYANGHEIPNSVRKLYRTKPDLQVAYPTPYQTFHPSPLRTWLRKLGR